MAKADLSAQRLRELLDYNPETGVLTWKQRDTAPRSWNTRYAGKATGSLDRKGRLRVNINGTPHLAHRLAWAIYHGDFVPLIDHRNTIASDNRISNLRACTNAENLYNRGANKNNQSGYKGVDRLKSGWRATITIDSKAIHLGMFKTPEEAHSAYCRAADKVHGEFVNYGTQALSR